MENKRIFKSIDGKQLNGLEFIPNNWNGKVIIFSFGYTISWDTDNKIQYRWADRFIEEGYKLIWYDYRGYGSSDGEFTKANPSSQIEDLIEIINQVDSEDVNEIILIGMSLGGLISKEVIESTSNNKISKCVLLCPAINFYEVYRSEEREQMQSPLFSWSDNDYVNQMEIDSEKYKDAMNKNRDDINYLIVHGIKDEVISIESSRNYSSLFNNIKLIEIDNGFHNLWSIRRSVDEPGAISIQDLTLNSIIDFIKVD